MAETVWDAIVDGEPGTSAAVEELAGAYARVLAWVFDEDEYRAMAIAALVA